MNKPMRLLSTLAAALLLGFYGWQGKDAYVDQLHPFAKAVQNASERVNFTQLFTHTGSGVSKSTHGELNEAPKLDIDFWIRELTIAANTLPTPFSPYQLTYFSAQGSPENKTIYLILRAPKSQTNMLTQDTGAPEIPSAGDIARNWICHKIEPRQIANGSVPNVLLEVQDPYGGVKTQEMIVTSHCG